MKPFKSQFFYKTPCRKPTGDHVVCSEDDINMLNQALVKTIYDRVYQTVPLPQNNVNNELICGIVVLTLIVRTRVI